MTKEKWLEAVREHQEDLASVIAEYHPRKSPPRHKLEITAPNAEAARQRVVAGMVSDEDPVQRFKVALSVGDIGVLYSVFDRTWFGVPESTSAWNIRGFARMVDLMDDPPDAEE